MAVESLALELQTFEERLPELLAAIDGHVGAVATFALVKVTEVISTFEAENDAIDEGYRQLGNVPFLVKEVTQYPTTLTFTRDIL